MGAMKKNWYPSEGSSDEEEEDTNCKGYKCPTTMSQMPSCKGNCPTTMFQLPLHYPRYKKADYEKMEEWTVDMLLKEYGISFQGTLDEKRKFAMATFLWPSQL